MAKKDKLLLIVAVLLSVIAMGFWVLNVTYEEDAGQDNTVRTENVNNGPADLGIGDQDFTQPFGRLNVSESFKINFVKVNDQSVVLVLDGDTSEAYTTEVIVEYDPLSLEVNELKQGDLFDLYLITPESIDNNAGRLRITASKTGQSNHVKTSGTLATIVFTKKTDQQVLMSIKEAESKVITEDGGTLNVRKNDINI